MHGLTLVGSSFPGGWIDEPNSKGKVSQGISSCAQVFVLNAPKKYLRLIISLHLKKERKDGMPKKHDPQ
jgi:hypothetical protein